MKVRDQRQEQLRDFGELFDICHNRHKGNPESVEAFETINDTMDGNRLVVMSLIRKSGGIGITTDEIALALDWTPNKVSPRVSELLKDGKIKRDGRRPTRSGCSASVLKIL